MPAKRKAPASRRMKGAGFFGDLWSGVKDLGKQVLTQPSRFAAMIPHPAAQAAARGLAAIGKGRKRKTGGARKGVRAGPAMKPVLMGGAKRSGVISM